MGRQDVVPELSETHSHIMFQILLPHTHRLPPACLLLPPSMHWTVYLNRSCKEGFHVFRYTILEIKSGKCVCQHGLSKIVVNIRYLALGTTKH